MQGRGKGQNEREKRMRHWDKKNLHKKNFFFNFFFSRSRDPKLTNQSSNIVKIDQIGEPRTETRNTGL